MASEDSTGWPPQLFCFITFSIFQTLYFSNQCDGSVSNTSNTSNTDRQCTVERVCILNSIMMSLSEPDKEHNYWASTYFKEASSPLHDVMTRSLQDHHFLPFLIKTLDSSKSFHPPNEISASARHYRSTSFN